MHPGPVHPQYPPLPGGWPHGAPMMQGPPGGPGGPAPFYPQGPHPGHGPMPGFPPGTMMGPGGRPRISDARPTHAAGGDPTAPPAEPPHGQPPAPRPAVRPNARPHAPPQPPAPLFPSRGQGGLPRTQGALRHLEGPRARPGPPAGGVQVMMGSVGSGPVMYGPGGCAAATVWGPSSCPVPHPSPGLPGCTGSTQGSSPTHR